MPVVNMQEAEANLSRLLETIEMGQAQEIVIARNGRPVARLVPLAETNPGARRLGLLEGKYATYSQDEFDAVNDQVAAMFYGET